MYLTSNTRMSAKIKPITPPQTNEPSARKNVSGSAGSRVKNVFKK
ncbi:Hypothetical protein BN2458_PEG2045 [Helicobacter typhlonius]|uniref:Uncharacterized protein n=1 Tax=Helicobacter typhlonius TaxID=76936 RepID=A0A0S4PZX5_9HELI|nr:Hypothetical protein BN2458_PEG2045 [Helicobacter typhlonius]